MSFLTSFYALVTALFASLIMVPFLRRWALDQGNVDVPDERKVHDTPMPRLGGIAIFVSFLLSSLVYAPMTHAVRGILVGSLIVFVTGLADDLNGLSAKHKFFGQILACVATIVIGRVYLRDFGNLLGFGEFHLSVWIGVPFTVFAVVGVINAINLIDGLDGLAGGVSVIAFTVFAALGYLEGDLITTFFSVAALGAVLGFLKYNFYPARIFMGDAGSLTLGFLLGFLALHLLQSPGSSLDPMVPVLVLGLPILDTLWVMTRRVLSGVSPFIADRTHLHHKFLDLGFEHRFTVILIYGISVFWGCSAILMRSLPEYLLLIFYLTTALTFYLLLRHLLQHPERYTFLRRDSDTEVRHSKTYEWLSALAEKLMPIMYLLLSCYFILSIYSMTQQNTVPWQIAGVLFCFGLMLKFSIRTQSRQFLMLIVYAALGIAANEVWQTSGELIIGLSFKRLGDVLLIMAGALAAIKIFFSKPGELFLTTIDFLTLAVCAILAVAAQKSVLGYNIYGPLIRCIVAIFAVRVLVIRGDMVQRNIVRAALVLLAVVLVVGLRSL